MNYDYRNLIESYVDDVITPEELSALGDWIKSDKDHARQFAEAIVLHDRLRNELSCSDEVIAIIEPASKIKAISVLSRSFSMLATVASAAVIGIFFLWNSGGQSSVSAAIRELDRIIEKNVVFMDRTYQISVEEIIDEPRRSNRPALPNEQRPPKPPLNDGIVYVRDGNQFVLVRKEEDGRSFSTGSNGRLSWAIRPDGPVRVSQDLDRFNRDLPGHENAIPLTNIHDGLEQLRKSYNVQYSPNGPEEYASQSGAIYRTLIAVKKPKERGPQRVEIAYDTVSGCIQHLRFIKMPYGPKLLDLRMSLVEERQLSPNFFDHENHHSPDRPVYMEE